jgi:hypothetical protein
MPFLLAGLRRTQSFVSTLSNQFFSPATNAEERPDALAAGCGNGWVTETFLPLMHTPKRLPPRGVWPRALARVATLPDVIFEVLRSKPNLVPSEDTEGREAAKIPTSGQNASAVDELSRRLCHDGLGVFVCRD